MALILKDRVKETSSSSGTGSITLGGAFPGYQTFNAAIASGSTVYYTIHNLSAGVDGEWEVGVGTFTSTATLSRDTVLSSSTGSKVNFTAGTNGLEVFITQPAEEAVYINQATNKVEAFGNGANTIAFTNINASNVVMVSGTISTNAANASDITNKTYVDGLFSTGISYHAPVLVESTSNLVAVYNQPNGAGNGVGATLTNSGSNAAIVIDGVTLSNTARVLVDNQSNAVQNGVYTVTNPGNVSAQWVLTRATDADTFGLASPTQLGQGDGFFVSSGNNGAGRTYICNTAGTITFGTTNITFAQISSAQIYSAGTGLSLTNTTFSVTNTAVTAGTYGNAGAVSQIAVNAQGQITSASNVSINASSITLGTLDNARTTAASANGASTIVARDANGNFTANVITATTSNATTFNGTTGSFTNVSGNGVALTAINASNISSGTIANARTTASDANSASTLVVRDANGSFGANIITATFSGNGATLSAINASNISSGTIANARTTAASANGASTIVQRDSGGSFDANLVNAVSLSGNAATVTGINASNIASGIIANARTTAATANGASTIVLRGASGEFAAGAITGTSFSGNGSALTAINATAITSGTLDNARTNATSANGASTLVVRDANGSFAGNVITGTTGTFTSVSGNGVALTAINASNISSGTIANARTTASDANGASTIVSRDANGSFSANVITATISGNGASLTNINASNISSGTIANARTTAATANGASTIVLRGTSGEFAAGAITGASFTGDGAAISAINASNVSTGTIANARTTGAAANGASTLVLRDANGSFAGNVVTGTTGTFTNISGNGVSLTAINASNITSGTIDNARTTAASANGASTIVARDANGSFAANVVTATSGSFTSVSGNGSALTALNGSNVSTGTVANARTTAATANGASTIVLRGTSGEFAAGIITADGSGLSAINASNVSTGTIANARTTAASANGASTIVARDAGGNFVANTITANLSGNATNVTGTVAVANGGTGATTAPAGLTNLRGWTTTATAAGTTTLTNTSTTQQNFTGSTTQTVVLPVTSTLALGWAFEIINNSTGTITVNSSGGNLVGTVIAGTTASIVCNLITGTDAASWDFDIDGFATETGTGSVVRATSPTLVTPALGTPSALVGTNITSINASAITTGTLDNARTTAATANGASTIVLRDANGSFAGNVVTATTGTFTSISGNGVALTAINASNISSGTVATARLATGTANATTYLRGDQTWATVSGGITLTNDTTTNASYYVTLTTATSGSISAANVSNTKLFFNPSTGTLTSTVHTSNSDERLKENWTDVTSDFVPKLAQVKHGVFSRKDSGNREPGVSAQSFITVLPEAVVEGADGYLSVNYGGAALVAAIELAKVVERLQAEIAELRAELKAK
jgi:hypothetical protein